LHCSRIGHAAILKAMLPLLLAAISVTPVLDDPPRVTGNCHPARVHFTGRITSTGAGAVRYAWVRSDKPSTATFTLTFDKAGSLPVTYDWLLQGPGDGWVVLHVISPQSAHSDKVKFQVKCGN
jgi:hypothetical protein